MKEFFAHLYEWFGLIPLWSKDTSDLLKGWDIACSGYYTTPWYMYSGLFMIVATGLIFALQYDLIDIGRFKQWEHWGLSAFFAFAVHFCLAFAIPFVAKETGLHCPRLVITTQDCILFGLSNGVWSVVLFGLLSAFHRLRLSPAGSGK